MTSNTSNLTAAQLLAIVRRRAWIVIIAMMLGLALSGLYVAEATKQYTATAALLFNNEQTAQQAAGVQAVVDPSEQSQQDTNVELLGIGDLAARTASSLGHGLTPLDVKNSVSIEPQSDTTVVDVAATVASPTLAAEMANTYASVFVGEQNVGSVQYYRQALASVNKQLAHLPAAERIGSLGVALAERAQSLATLSELRGSVEIAQVASVPTAPSAPEKGRMIALGALLGLIVGLAVAAALERLDFRIRTPEDLSQIYGMPVAGSIPETASLRRPRGGASVQDLEAFRSVRAFLRYGNSDRTLKTVLVTSAVQGDGKTTVATNLARAAASVGESVLLIEADLRRPTVAEKLGVAPWPGLADVLVGSRALDEALQSVSTILKWASGNDGRGRLDVLVASAVPGNPGELLESAAMEETLRAGGRSYDLVIIDTPPLNLVPDAFPLLPRVDGIIVVGRVGRTSRAAATRLAETLGAAGGVVVGLVANGLRRSASTSYSYYGKYTPEGAHANGKELAPRLAEPAVDHAK